MASLQKIICLQYIDTTVATCRLVVSVCLNGELWDLNLCRAHLRLKAFETLKQNWNRPSLDRWRRCQNLFQNMAAHTVQEGHASFFYITEQNRFCFPLLATSKSTGLPSTVSNANATLCCCKYFEVTCQFLFLHNFSCDLFKHGNFVCKKDSNES